jgi:hypothetical protein
VNVHVISYVFIHFLLFFGLLHSLFLVGLVRICDIIISILSGGHDPLHDLLVLGNLIDGFRETLHQDQVWVVRVQLKDTLEVLMGRRRFTNATHLQVFKEIFGFDDLYLPCGSILVLVCGLLGLHHLLINDAIEELMQGHVELHHG